MGIIIALISAALCALLYVRMVRRETTEPMPKKKAAIPVAAGLLAPFLATVLTVGIGFAVRGLTGGRSVSETIGNQAVAALTGSFLAAGMTEELVKFLLFLLIRKRLRPRNVYECAVLVAGIGFGFTVLEEIGYGGDSPLTSLSRLPGFAMHMVFGLVMGLFLGLAGIKKQEGESDRREICFALLLPILWHTVYDASTGFNGALSSEDARYDAMLAIKCRFAAWEGCELHTIRYAGDQANSAENLEWMNSLEEGTEYTQVTEFLMDFHSPVEEGPYTWNPDTEYTDYQWWLARSDDGDWEIVSWGY